MNDLNEHLSSTSKLYADDTKIIGTIKNTIDTMVFQEDLDKLSEWSKTWLIHFNVDKCKIMHLGSKNPNLKYTLNGNELIEVSEEKDLGIYTSNDLKWGKQCNIAAAKANRILGRLDMPLITLI